jgi:hypothetical protein
MGKETQQAKTNIEKLGFKDKDLGTPKHDEIVLWLLKQENCGSAEGPGNIIL